MGIENKVIQIEEAIQGERVIENVIVGNSQEFIKKLSLVGVDDLFASNVKIKHDRERYIVSVDGKNIFAVNGARSLENYVQAFYDDKAATEKREENKKAFIRITGLNIEYITGKTKEELDLLKEEMQNQQDAYEASMDLPNIKNKLERNINFYEVEIKDAQDKSRLFYAPKGEYTREDKSLFKLHVAQMQERLDRLQKMQKEILKIEAGKYANADVNEREKQKTLKRFNDEITEIARDSDDFVTQRNDIIEHKGTTTTYYSINIASLRDAQKAKEALSKYNDDYKRINSTLLNADRKQELAEDLTALNIYLNKVLSNPNTFDPSKEPFVPTHLEAFNELLRVDPTLRRFAGEGGIPTSKEKKNINTETGSTSGTGTESGVDLTTGSKSKSVSEGGIVEGTTTSTESAPNVKYEGAGDAFAKGGVYGIIDHFTEGIQGKDPRTQQFYKSFGNAALTIGGLVVGWKVLRNARRLAFGKKEDIEKNNSRAWVLGGAGLLLATGGRPGEIFRGGEITQNLATMVGGFRGRKKESGQKNPVTDVIPNNATPETQQLYGISKATVLFEGMNFGQMAPFVTEGSDKKMILDKEKLKNELIANKTRPGISTDDLNKIETKLGVLASLGNDKNSLIDIGLNNLGLTYKQIASPGNKDKSFNTLAGGALARMGAIGPYMQKEKFVRVATEEPTKKAALESYIQTGYPSLEELKNGGVFIMESGALSGSGATMLSAEYRVEQDKNKGKFAEQITTKLPNLNQLQKNNLIRAGVLFYDYMPSGDKKINIVNDNGKTYFETYGFKTPVNFESMFMDDLMSTKVSESGKAISFVEPLEFLKAANLTNRIKALCKNRKAQSYNPFSISKPGGDIEFDDAETTSLKFDTEILSAGYGGALGDISPVLEDHKDDYVTYLNKHVECIKPATA